MVEKIIVDNATIKKIIGKDAKFLIIKYNTKNKRAWYQTDTMIKRKAIDISRVACL